MACIYIFKFISGENKSKEKSVFKLQKTRQSCF